MQAPQICRKCLLSRDLIFCFPVVHNPNPGTPILARPFLKMKSPLLALIGSLAFFGVSALGLEKRTALVVLSIPFVRNLKQPCADASELEQFLPLS
jgi:hypothetical protein